MKDSESKIQAECVKWYNNKYCLKFHKPRNIIFHVPNENQHFHVNLGVLGGVADLVLIHFGQLFFIEMKDHKGKQGAKQIDFEERVKEHGIPYHLCRSLEEFKQIIEGL